MRQDGAANLPLPAHTAASPPPLPSPQLWRMARRIIHEHHVRQDGPVDGSGPGATVLVSRDNNKMGVQESSVPLVLRSGNTHKESRPPTDREWRGGMMIKKPLHSIVFINE